ncbi:hypothetical protein KI387_041539, partial [Taxus chinensis]
ALVVVAGVILPLAYGEVVIDIAEQSLEAGSEYHIVPYSGGGLGLKMRQNNSCPMYVDYNNKEQGLPVVFTPYKSDKQIEVAADFMVHVSGATGCAPQSTRWRMKLDDKLNKYFVYAGNSTNSSSSTTDLDYFRILESEIYGNVYVLSFCPSVCDNCRPVCGLLGIYTDKAINQWL